MRTDPHVPDIRTTLAMILDIDPKGKRIKKILRRLNWVLQLREMDSCEGDPLALAVLEFNLSQSIREIPAYLSFALWQTWANKTENFITIRQYLRWATGVATDSMQCDRIVFFLSQRFYLDEYGFTDAVIDRCRYWLHSADDDPYADIPF